ncbi:uncharacterized protein ISCGN_011115 [Ixodes scapularis]
MDQSTSAAMDGLHNHRSQTAALLWTPSPRLQMTMKYEIMSKVGETDELLRQIQQEQWRHHATAIKNPAYAQQLRQILTAMRRYSENPM